MTLFSTQKTKAYIPSLIVKENCDFVKVYRIIIDYTNPFYDFKDELDMHDVDYGVPVLFINPETEKHINSFYNLRFIDNVLNGFMSTSNIKDDTGYSWLNDMDNKSNLWTLSENNGSNHGKNMGNIYGRKLSIKKLTNRHYRQTYEFTGAINEHFDTIDIGIMLPVYRNVNTKKYTYTLIKNIIFSCDTLTTSSHDIFNIGNYSDTTNSEPVTRMVRSDRYEQ